MSPVTSSDFVQNSPKSEKYKTNSLLLMMNGNFEKNMMLDVSDIASILVSVGFKPEKIKNTNNNTVDELENKDDNQLKIILSCGRSGLEVVYTKQDYVCNCQEDFKADTFKEEILENEVKNRPNRRASLAKDLLQYIMAQKDQKNVTNNEVELNEEFQTPIGPHCVEVENTEQASNWEVDPKTSPPVMTSSPILEPKVETCSFCLEKEQKIASLIEEAKTQVVKNIEAVLELLPKINNTFTKKKFKRVSDIPKVPATITPKSNRSENIKSTVKRISPKKSARKMLLSTQVKSATPKLEKSDSPRRDLLKNYYKSPLNSQLTRSPLSPLSRSPITTKKVELTNKKSRLDTPLPDNEIKPQNRKCTLVKNYCSPKSPLATKTTPISKRDTSTPESKTLKVVKSSIPKINNVNAVTSSTHTNLKTKTGIPTFNKFQNFQKIKY